MLIKKNVIWAYVSQHNLLLVAYKYIFWAETEHSFLL